MLVSVVRYQQQQPLTSDQLEMGSVVLYYPTATPPALVQQHPLLTIIAMRKILAQLAILIVTFSHQTYNTQIKHFIKEHRIIHLLNSIDN